MDDITLSKLKKNLSKRNAKNISAKAAFNILLSKAQKDNTLSNFKEIINILNIMSIKKGKENEGSYYHRLIIILSIYEKIIDSLLNEDNPMFEKSIPFLEEFFSVFHRDEKIKKTKKVLPVISLFSQRRKAANLISKIEEKYIFFNQKSKEVKSQSSQTALVSLLDDILKGKALISGLSGAEDEEKRKESFLPSSEFAVLKEIPEDPNVIGYSNTMSFNVVNEKRSLYETFGTESLKEEFLSKFPWGASMESIDKLENAQLNHVDLTLNLIGTRTILPSSLQLSATQYILLSLDTLGKLAGYTGEMAIKSFEHIHFVTSNLAEITALLQADFEPHFERNLSERIAQTTQAIFNLNRTLTGTNPVMNGFCHINERLAHLLLRISYRHSILTPNQPSSPYREEIDKVVTLVKPAITASHKRPRKPNTDIPPRPHHKKKKQKRSTGKPEK